MKTDKKKFCIYCDKTFGMKNNYCPVCGRELQTKQGFNLIKSFEPFLKGTKFRLVESRDGYHYSFIYDYDGKSSRDKDTKKILKRFAKEKPNFLTPTVDIYNDFGTVVFAIHLITKETPYTPFMSSLRLPVNKANTELILCLIGKDNISDLIIRCQSDIKWRSENLKKEIAVVNQYKKLYQQLSLKKEE